ncbi:MAG: hypothetical protein AAGD01_05470 [Acidobacteriota bacterium]
MKRRQRLACASTPEGDELVLWQWDQVFQIEINGLGLMSSRSYGSEEALGRLVVENLAQASGKRPLQILVGGLGMGYTLRALLDALDEKGLGANAAVEVAEVSEAVVDWNRSHLGHLAQHPLEDPRVRLRVEDVARCLQAPQSTYDAVVLDVDNGPEALTLESNGSLYSRRGLGRLHRALIVGGWLALWSASPSQAFEDKLRKVGFRARSVMVRGRYGAAGKAPKGARHVIFLARKIASQGPYAGQGRRPKKNQPRAKGRR